MGWKQELRPSNLKGKCVWLKDGMGSQEEWRQGGMQVTALNFSCLYSTAADLERGLLPRSSSPPAVSEAHLFNILFLFPCGSAFRALHFLLKPSVHTWVNLLWLQVRLPWDIDFITSLFVGFFLLNFALFNTEDPHVSQHELCDLNLCQKGFGEIWQKIQCFYLFSYIFLLK